MSGEELYELWADSMGVCANTSVDSWEDLEQGDRDAWERTAAAIAV